MKLFLKYLFIALSLFLSVQINACDFGKKSEVQSSDYYTLVSSTSNEGRYEAGRLVVPVASTVVPIVGQVGKISKISKLKTILKGIKKLSTTKSDDLIENLNIPQAEVKKLSKVGFGRLPNYLVAVLVGALGIIVLVLLAQMKVR